MRVLVTGASGWIGTAVVPELLTAGHQVSGLVRSDTAAQALQALGAEAVRGSLDDLDVLARAAAGADGVVHLAFRHDLAFTGDFPAAVAADLAAIDTVADALDGTGKAFVIASGVLGLAPGRIATERDGQDAPSGSDPSGSEDGPTRLTNAQRVVALASRGIRSSVLRLPPTVHGDGDAGFVPTLIGIARDKGAAGYVDDGTNRWPAVHRSDAARLFRLAVETAPAGATLHAIQDEGVPTRTIAEIFGRHLNLPVVAVPAAEAFGHFGWIGGFFGLDSPASSTLTRQLTGWEPTGPGLLEDLEAGHYFG